MGAQSSPEGPAETVLHNLVEDLFTLLQLQALPPRGPPGLEDLVPKEEDMLLWVQEGKSRRSRKCMVCFKKRERVQQFSWSRHSQNDVTFK